MTALRIVNFGAGGLAIIDGVLIIGSLAVGKAETVPSMAIGVSIVVGGIFVLMGLILVRIACHMHAIEATVSRWQEANQNDFRQLTTALVAGGVICLFVFAMAASAILSRIGEGYPVFG